MESCPVLDDHGSKGFFFTKLVAERLCRVGPREAFPTGWLTCLVDQH